MAADLWSTLVGAEALIRQLQEQVFQLQGWNQELSSAGFLSSMELRNLRDRVAALERENRLLQQRLNLASLASGFAAGTVEAEMPWPDASEDLDYLEDLFGSIQDPFEPEL